MIEGIEIEVDRAWQPSTVNTIVVLDADPEPAAFVNLVIMATECKTLVARAVRSALEDGIHRWKVDNA